MSSEQVPVLEHPAAAGPQTQSVASWDVVAPPKTGVVRVGVIGFGYWGPNIVRNFHGLENCEMVAVCDKSPDALKRARRIYPGVRLTTDFNEILTAPDIDAVAVITPVWTHFELAKKALLNGKHVFVESRSPRARRRPRS
jgi:predicted dinucleotide-utilizing enzyme